jgi:pyruvate dehydrogenase E1 component alpha subunit
MDERQNTRLQMLRSLIRIRCVEETLADLYKDEQEMRTPTHFSIGQEAVGVGVSAALETQDTVFCGHRCHAQYLAKGGDLKAMVAELYGKETGCARGRGGSVHLNDDKAGVGASSAILGQTIAVAVGAAMSYQMNGERRISVAYFGDGTVEEGIWHESLNFAAVRKIPILFVCENNGYSTLTPLGRRQPAGIEIFERSKSYGLSAEKVDGNDAFAVHAAAANAVARIRDSKGPQFLECTTYRWREHVGPLWDYDWGYRTKEEVDSWIARCPIKRASEQLIRDGICTAKDIHLMKSESQTEVDDAVTAAKESPFPSVDGILEGTY